MIHQGAEQNVLLAEVLKGAAWVFCKGRDAACALVTARCRGTSKHLYQHGLTAALTSAAIDGLL